MKFVKAKGANKLKIVYYETPEQPSPIQNYHDLFGREPRYYEHGFFYNPRQVLTKEFFSLSLRNKFWGLLFTLFFVYRLG